MIRNNVRVRRLAAVGLGVLGLSGCTDWAGYDLDYFWGNFAPLATMRGTIAYEPYELPRLPAEGSVPVLTPMGDTPGPFTQMQLDSAGATLVNPFAGGAAPEVLARGQEMYTRQCAVCHGPQGAGNGPVVGAGKYPLAPAINTSVTAARSDGYLYGIIAVGRGLMPSYGERVTHVDRWAIVSYVRQLQGGAGAQPASVPGVPTVVNPADSAAAPGAD